MLKNIIFDMDGTITKPYIDWRALRAEIGVPPDQMIMHYINTLEGEAKRIAIKELTEKAQEMGANAIVGIDLDYETIRGSMLMVSISGTAVAAVKQSGATSQS